MSLKYRPRGRLSACRIFQILYSPEPKSNMKVFGQAKQLIVTTKGKMHLRYCIYRQILYSNITSELTLILFYLMYCSTPKSHSLRNEGMIISDGVIRNMKGCAVAVELIVLIIVFLPSCENLNWTWATALYSQRLSALTALINHLPCATETHIHAVYSSQ